jgi:hypothetical protein
MSENVILIDSGVVTKTLRTTDGKECSFSFNPLDMAFSRKLFTAFEKLDAKQEKYKEEVQKNADKTEIFDIGEKMNAEMRDIIDNDVFGFDVCDSLFGSMNVYALANGLPVWANLLFAMVDETDNAYAREQKLTNPRIAKYTKKYHK